MLEFAGLEAPEIRVAEVPPSPHLLSEPRADKWTKNAHELAAVASELEGVWAGLESAARGLG